MKNFIIWLLIAFIFIGSIIYFVFSSDKSLNITYIKFNINPEFVIGVNNSDEVKIYNPLNDDAKVLNLTMFNGMKIDSAMDIIFDKLAENNFLDVSQIDITVITKNDDKIAYYYEKINSVIKENSYHITLVNNEANYDELLAYSNEVTYDLKATYANDILLNVAINLEDDIKHYIDDKLSDLNLNNLAIAEKKDMLTLKQSENYFNDYAINNYQVKNFPMNLLDNSNYQVEFIYGENDFSYTIILNLTLEVETELVKEDITYKVFEEYIFNYQNGQILNLKNNFYKFAK